MSTPTINMQLTKPALGETADIGVINTNMDTIDAHRRAGGTDGLAVRAVQAGLWDNRPAVGTPGRVYVVTDRQADTGGTEWELAAPGELEVVAKSNTTPNGVATLFNIGAGVAAKKVEVRKNGLVKVETDDYSFTVGNTYVVFVTTPLTGDVVVMNYVPQ